jgi:hypothetical protein
MGSMSETISQTRLSLSYANGLNTMRGLVRSSLPVYEDAVRKPALIAIETMGLRSGAVVLHHLLKPLQTD